MPRIRDRMQRSVFFLFGNDYRNGQIIGPGGTGFFVRRFSRRLRALQHIYAITSRHIVADFYNIRVNDNLGGSQFIEFDPSDWQYANGVDLAAVDVTDSFMLTKDRPTNNYSVDFLEGDGMLSQMHLNHHLGIGVDTIMMGLLADYPGVSRNVPVGRFGSLAALPDPELHIRLSANDSFAGPAFLNDLRSRAGFSGSPVWAWVSPFNDIGAPSQRARELTQSSMDDPRLHLIGVHRGQLKETIDAFELAASLKEPKRISLEIPSAMTVVIPAWEISSLLDGERFADERSNREARPDVLELYDRNTG